MIACISNRQVCSQNDYCGPDIYAKLTDLKQKPSCQILHRLVLSHIIYELLFVQRGPLNGAKKQALIGSLCDIRASFITLNYTIHIYVIILDM